MVNSTLQQHGAYLIHTHFSLVTDMGKCKSNPRTSPAIQGSSAAQMRAQLQTQKQHHVYNNQRQHHVNGPNLASPLVSVTRRGLQPLHMPEQNVGFFIYPPPQPRSTSGEPERDQFNHAWERDLFPYFPVPRFTA